MLIWTRPEYGRINSLQEHKLRDFALICTVNKKMISINFSRVSNVGDICEEISNLPKITVPTKRLSVTMVNVENLWKVKQKYINLNDL